MRKSKPTEKRTSTKTLYVIFHGELLFLDNPQSDEIVALAPEMPEHVYMAGPWLGEQNILHGAELRLQGVCSDGEDSIHHHCDRFVIFTNTPGNTMACPHFHIHLPRPEQILPGLIVTLDPGQDTIISLGPKGVGFEGGKPAQLDLHPVFKYTAHDGVPFLGPCAANDDMWTWPAREGKPGNLSLHVFAEIDRHADFGHVRMAFEMAADLIGVQADLNPNAQGQLVPPSDCYGLHRSEIEMSLSERVCTEAGLGTQLRQDLPLCWDDAHSSCTARGRWTMTCFGPGHCGPIGH